MVKPSANLEKMQEQLNLLSLLPEANPNIVFIRSCEGEFVYANPAARQWIHRHHDEETHTNQGLTLLNQLLPPYLEENLCPHCRENQITTYRINRKDQVFDLKARPLAGERKCLFTLTDISELEKAHKEKALFQKAFETSVQSIIITDAKGKILFANQMVKQLYGYSQADLLGKTPNAFNPGRKVYEDLGYTEEAYNRLFSGLWKSITDPEQGSWEGILPNRTREGRLVWVKLIINALRNKSGEITHFIGFPVNITDSLERERPFVLRCCKP